MSDHEQHILNQEEGPENEGRLFKMPRKQPFDVPEGYFEKLPLKMQERIRPEEASFWKHILSLILKPQFAVPVFATLILIVLGLIYYNSSFKEGSREIAVSRPEKSDVQDQEEERILAPISSIKKEEVKVKHTEQLEVDMIVEEIQEEAVSEEEELLFYEEKLASAPVEEINYLLENDIDVSLILDELQKN